MPLRDHFRLPAFKYASWESVHCAWPTLIVMSLANKLPPPYVAHPQANAGAFAEIDVTTCERDEAETHGASNGNGNGAVATAVWAPPLPTLTVETDLPSQDEYEVRIYSPGNKDRPENRRAFVTKCAALLQKQVSVTIVDLVTIRTQNLYGELLDSIDRVDPALGADPPAIYAAACRVTKTTVKPGAPWQLETWFEPLRIGQPLPTLPLWLADNLAVPLDLEGSYEETCKVLRIA